MRVQVKNQELAVPADAGVLVLAPSAARTPVLQPIFRRREVFVHLTRTHFTFVFSLCLQLEFSPSALPTLHQRTRMLPGLSCSSSIWTGGWEETEPWRDTQSLSTPSRESSSCAETLGTSTNAGTSGRLRNKNALCNLGRSFVPRWRVWTSHLSSWMCMAFLVKLPSLSSFSPRPQRRAASPGRTEERSHDHF